VRPLAEVRDLPAEGEADLRYRGQSFELTVPLEPDLAAAFHRAHEERYGYADPGRDIELVAVRTADVVPGPDVSFTSPGHASVTGPELVELPGATCWVPDRWRGETNDDGTLVLTR
jgi:N-methylhydantoinase A/oxoprolinase/acetone carboxylase beta subunit